ncbi:hypothetical protein [Falsihalocynthiibacter arcticus]|uniref:hypothetical protein n=1 Tax=Falsihalocynthiibacter arcticus TaxID=1579316 RepID=UPI0030019D77
MQFNSEAITLFNSGRGIVARWLFWVEPKNRSTGAIETLGLWTGEYDRTFTINGLSRSYSGAAGLVGQSDPTYETGLDVRTHTVSLGPLSPEVEQLLRGYDTRLAAAEIHLAIFDPDTLALVDVVRTFKGSFDSAPITTPEVGGTATATAELVSAARNGTRGLSLKKSNAAQELRGGDQFRKYADVSGSVPVWWGGG